MDLFARTILTVHPVLRLNENLSNKKQNLKYLSLLVICFYFIGFKIFTQGKRKEGREGGRKDGTNL